eukprot:1157533-Pelagomonas_calceolata.AAC.2
MSLAKAGCSKRVPSLMLVISPTVGRRVSIKIEALDEGQHYALKVHIIQAMDEDLETCGQFNVLG